MVESNLKSVNTVGGKIFAVPLLLLSALGMNVDAH